MPPVEDLWERLVRAALHRDRIGTDAYGRHGGIAANVPSSLTNNRDIDSILRAADEIQDEDATISRICMYYFYLFSGPRYLSGNGKMKNLLFVLFSM